MSAAPPGLASALQDRYRLERELGRGGMATELGTEVTLKDSLTVAARLRSLKRPGFRFRGHFSDLSRVAALAADSEVQPDA